MKRIRYRAAIALLWIWLIPQSVSAAELLVPVGQIVGLELGNGTVTVAAFDEALGKSAQAAGLEVGDQILAINETKITCPEDIRQALEHSDGNVALQVSRDGQAKTLHLSPEITDQGPKLGIYLRQGVTGVGTVTFFDPDTGKFGALGHGVNDKNGALLEMIQGNAYPAQVVSVKKGQSGTPGQLMGSVTDRSSIGSLTDNCIQGVFGVSESGWLGEAIPVGTSDMVRTGPAQIRSTVEGTTVREYSVEILKIYPKSRENGRNLLIKITDPELLETTGGIVQGMSGSPIIQDGKLVGAVTHVLVNDPTTGYGIFIENMLDAAA